MILKDRNQPKKGRKIDTYPRRPNYEKSESNGISSIAKYSDPGINSVIKIRKQLNIFKILYIHGQNNTH